MVLISNEGSILERKNVEIVFLPFMKSLFCGDILYSDVDFENSKHRILNQKFVAHIAIFLG